MKKSILLCLVCFLLASCCKEEVTELTVPQPEPQTRGSYDIFKVVKIDAMGHSINSPYKVVDNEGNFYWPTTDCIYKFDHQTNQTVEFISFDITEYCSPFCFDNKNNLCFISYNNLGGNERYYFLRRISQDGNYYDQPLTLDPTIERFTGIFANAQTGNITVMADNNRPYKISARGVVSEAFADWNPMEDVHMAQLYKVNANIGFYVGYNYYSGYSFHKINFGNGNVEEIQFRINPSHGLRGIASGTAKPNLFVLDGNYIVQLRPNAATDLDVGVIPSTSIDQDGESFDVGEPMELYMNFDATIFYVYSEGYESFYKLSL